eukprot:EG_transcript_2170
MAAWGITYGTSYDKVSTMAVEFTGLAQANLKTFGSFVSDLLRANAALVDSILALERRATQNGTDQTTAAMAHTIGVLVNYTTNATGQSQRQMNTVVDTFGDLMDAVVTDFRSLASDYAGQVRSDLATQGSTLLVTFSNQAASVMRRLQKLIDVGLLDLSQSPDAPIGDTDCTLLAIICDGTEEFGSDFTLATATGRRYECGLFTGATLSAISVGGGLYNETNLEWPPSGSTQPPMKQLCLAGPTATQAVGLNCPLPEDCGCGADPRCAPWYRLQVGTYPYHYSSNVYYDQGIPTLHMSMPLFNSSANPPILLGVIDAEFALTGIDYYMGTLLGFSTDTYIAILLNDTNLTAIASLVRPCPANTAPSGDAALPLRSGFRSCDPGLQEVAQWVAGHRALTSPFPMESAGLSWVVFPTQTAIISFFFVVGTNRTQAERPIDASVARANTQLTTVRTQLLGQVAASGLATQAYMAAVGAENIAATQALQDSVMADIAVLENASRLTLAASQDESSANVQSVTASQAATVEARKAEYLNDMATTSGWTIAVVFGLLCVVLLLSAWGTIHVTNSLVHIIGLMEDVAEMKVENLEVPQSSGVREVARIQTAFQVLVRRLAEYKSYIPAGLFEKEEPRGKVKDAESSDEGFESDQRSAGFRSSSAHYSQSTADDPKAFNRQATGSSGPADTVGASKRSSSAGGPQPPSPTRRSIKRNAAVLSINVLGFMDVLLAASDGLSKGIFNDYVSRVHEAVSQGRGNIDCILGDQIFVTFNAHIPCSDPAGAAAAAALDVRSQLLSRMGDRLKFQLGLAFGAVFASSVGYTKFKSMVTVGGPMKVASLLAHLPRFENGAILADANLEERLKYSYAFRPADLLHLPQLKSFAKSESTSHRVSLLLSKKNLQEDEWIYQVEDMASASDWNQTFEQLAAARSLPEGQSILQKYLAGCPHDEVALRLKDRLALWTPSVGLPL